MFYKEDFRGDKADYSEIYDFIGYLVNYDGIMPDKILTSQLQNVLSANPRILDIPNIVLSDAIKSIPKEYLKKIIALLLNNNETFKYYNCPFEISPKIKFGLEIETYNVRPTKVELLYKRNMIPIIMENLRIPPEIINSICGNLDFKQENIGDKWIVSKEGWDETEISTPILMYSPQSVNQISAMCTLLKGIQARVNGGTGLHINIGVDYFECNADALWNFLKIWGECEELFFKMASPDGEVIRTEAMNYASPVADNIQRFINSDKSITLDTEEDKEEFLYNIQVRNRLARIIRDVDSSRLPSLDLGSYLWAYSEEKRRKLYNEYRVALEER